MLWPMKCKCCARFGFYFLLGLCITLSAYSQSTDKSQSILARAEKALQEDRLNRAGKLLLQLIRQEPDNKPAYLLMAEVYYAKGDLNKAKRSFEMAAPETIEPRYGFAWGAAFYEAGEWRQAIKGFSQSIMIEGLEDYSHYYMGASYYQLRGYFRAQQHLNQARSSRLPESLRRNKQQLLQMIRMKKEQDLRSVIAPDNVDGGSQNVSQGISRGVPIPSDQNAGAYRFRSPKQESYETDQNRPLFQIAYTPAFMFHQANTLNENFNFVRNSLDITAHRESLAVAATRLVEDQRFQEDQTIGLQIFGGNANYDAKISDERIVTLDETTGGFIQKDITRIKEKQGFFGVEPFIRIPLNSNLSLDAKLLHHEILPKYDSKGRWGLSLIHTKLQYQQGQLSGFAMISFTNQFDKNQSYEFQDQFISMGIGIELQDIQIQLSSSLLQTSGGNFLEVNPYRYVIADPRMRVSDGYMGFWLFRAYAYLQLPLGGLALNIQNKERFTYQSDRRQRQYPIDSIELASLNISQVALRYALPVLTGVSVTGEGFYHLYGDYWFAGDFDELSNSQQTYQTGVTQTGYQLGVSVTPIEWFRFHAHFATHLNRYDQEDELDQGFKAKNPSFGSSTQFLLELTKDF